MLEINYKEKIYNFRNLFSEITIEEYQNITAIFSEEQNNNISLWIKIFEALEWDEEVVDNMDFKAFENIITEFNFNDINKEIIKTIEIEGVNYSCYEEEGFKLKIRDLLKIEEILNTENYLVKIAALLYKRDGFTKAENEDIKHLEYKVKMFRKQPANVITPLLEIINTSLIKKHAING